MADTADKLQIIDRLLENAFKADERLSRANEIANNCTQSIERLTDLIEKLTTTYDHHIQQMQDEKRMLLQYILNNKTIKITNKNEM